MFISPDRVLTELTNKAGGASRNVPQGSPRVEIPPDLPEKLWESAKPILDRIRNQVILIEKSGFPSEAETLLAKIRRKIGNPVT